MVTTEKLASYWCKKFPNSTGKGMSLFQPPSEVADGNELEKPLPGGSACRANTPGIAPFWWAPDRPLVLIGSCKSAKGIRPTTGCIITRKGSCQTGYSPRVDPPTHSKRHYPQNTCDVVVDP